tara:strand:- start:30421 stop:30654 length:234 start_codon:yes stop_codon:yes gene_type:complete
MKHISEVFKYSDAHKQLSKRQEDRTEQIESYVKWYNEECSTPYSELEWLITCALDSSYKEDVIEVLDTTHKHITEIN